jgi:glucose dehydrogenase
VWSNTTDAAPTVVSKAALANGLVYSYTVDANNDWYFTALDFRTGKVVYKAYAGTGLGFNNNYAGISISPRGVEYLGAIGGLISLRDGG